LGAGLRRDGAGTRVRFACLGLFERYGLFPAALASAGREAAGAKESAPGFPGEKARHLY
jgi:hypothetical protein